jgi:GTP cyclohydrolase II
VTVEAYVQLLGRLTATIFAAAAIHRTKHFGDFQILVTDKSATGGEHVVLFRGDIFGKENVLCRVASACLTSTALDSAECECTEQLVRALEAIDSNGTGILIYLDQEGRGHGITTKIRALAKKNSGLDTFAAVEALGLDADVRQYDIAAKILDSLDVRSICLMTSNPDKEEELKAAGIKIAEVVPLKVRAPELAERHLAAKRLRGHKV